MHRLLAMTATAASVRLPARQADEVHVLNWKGYGADEPWAIEAFEKATGNKVINDFFNSEQEMLTKLRTNPGLYDVVMINACGGRGIYLGDIILTAGGRPVSNVQALLKLMLGPAIGTRLPVTLLRRGAFVDVVTVPAELSTR